MRLAITDDHRELSRVARAVLTEREALVDARSALNGSLAGLPRFWRDAIDLGWLGLHIGEEHGGQGFGLSELAVVAEELGRVVAPGPFLPTVVAGALLDELGTAAERDRWLLGLCSGSVTAAIALDARLSVRGSNVTGTAGPVLGSNDADLFFLPAGESMLVLERNAVTSVTALPPVDPTLPLVRVGCGDSMISAVLEDGKGAARRVLARSPRPWEWGEWAPVWTCRSSTPRSAISSGVPSAASKPCNISAPTCWSTPSSPPPAPGTPRAD